MYNDQMLSRTMPIPSLYNSYPFFILFSLSLILSSLSSKEMMFFLVTCVNNILFDCMILLLVIVFMREVVGGGEMCIGNDMGHAKFKATVAYRPKSKSRCACA